MTEETKMILKMVEDGKITSDEAIKLLKTLRDRNNGCGIDIEDKIQKASKAVGGFAKDVNKTVSSLAKKAEPVVKDFTYTVIDKTSEITNNVGKAVKGLFDETPSKAAADDDNDEIEILEMGEDVEESESDETIEN
ncbi:MAG: hypothetical protein IJ736_02910 [Firmicutes bacterium]|nr:hypothetical protein [Bacillota bacterium]